MFKKLINILGGALSQAKGVFSNWWNNIVVSPEPGLTKQAETDEIYSTEEAHNSSTESRQTEESIPNESKKDVDSVKEPDEVRTNDGNKDAETPKSINGNLEDKSKFQLSANDFNDCGVKNVIKEVHQPGQVHTV